mgnify:CR=1 FL=1
MTGDEITLTIPRDASFHEIAHLVWYCSQFFVLEPGDLITATLVVGETVRSSTGTRVP